MFSPGTSFRDEIHSILHDIQTKYASHWKHHELNIQQVQSQAGDQLQSLMKNVVGKYIKLNELQQSTSTPPSSVETPSMVTGGDRYLPVQLNELCHQYQNTVPSSLETPSLATDRYMPYNIVTTKPPATEFHPTASYHNAETGYLPSTEFITKYHNSKLLAAGEFCTTSTTKYCSSNNTEEPKYLPGGHVVPSSLMNTDNLEQTTDSTSINMDQSSTSTMDTVLQNTQYQQTLLNPVPQKYTATNNLNSNNAVKGNHFPLRYLRPLYVDTGVTLPQQQQQKHIHTDENLLRIADPPPQQRTIKQNIPEHSCSQITEEHEQVKIRKTEYKEEKQQTPLLNEIEKLKTKEELKEFWRHKLLQPNPLETLRKEEDKQDHLRPNHLDNDMKSKDIAVYSRNQY